MTNQENNRPDLVALADGTDSGPQWDVWLAAHPDAAAEVAVMRQTRELLQQLRTEAVEVPADLEARVLSQVYRNTALRELFNLNLVGTSRAMLELLTLFFSFMPSNQNEEVPIPRNA